MATPRGKRYAVLLVDDNRDLLLLITESLRMLGDYTIVTAENGVQGLHRAIEMRPDCMVIDIKMPGLDGYQLVRALRGDPATASMPLVMLTAMVQDSYRFAGLLAGADQFLTRGPSPTSSGTSTSGTVVKSSRNRLSAA